MNKIKIISSIFKWTARILETLLLATVFVIFIGESASNGFPNPFGQTISVRIEFTGMFILVCGLILGWKWQGPGGILILAGNVMFHIIEGKFYINPAFALFDLTGLLYIASWFQNRFPESTDEI